jgi:hypothetical protein
MGGHKVAIQHFQLLQRFLQYILLLVGVGMWPKKGEIFLDGYF